MKRRQFGRVRHMVVNLIPRSLSGESNPDSEPNLAVNPANPQLIVASAFTPNPAGSGEAPIFVSTDGGNTWSLHAIVPSDQMTADITLRFGSSSNNLYAGIIRTPIVSNSPRLNILRTNNVLSGLPMDVLVDRTGQGVDQPYIQAATVPDGKGGSVGVVVCGDNDFSRNLPRWMYRETQVLPRLHLRTALLTGAPDRWRGCPLDPSGDSFRRYGVRCISAQG